MNLQPGQHFGLCPGVGPGGAARPTARFDWLHHLVQRMPPQTIDALAERGRLTAPKLTGLAFERHQWVRLRTLLGAPKNEVLPMRQYRLNRDAVVAAPVAGRERCVSPQPRGEDPVTSKV